MSLLTPDSTFLSNRILALPKLDKANFISAYLQEQTAHAKTYASQGQALLSSWKSEDLTKITPSNVEEPEKARLLSKLLVVDYGFGTPVLKPRVVMRTTKQIERSLPKENETATLPKDLETRAQVVETNQEQNVKRKRTTSDSPVTVAKPKSQPRKVRGRRKDSDSDLESEHAKRLKERRDRKRAKRAIIKPTTGVDSESETVSERTTMLKKGKTKKAAKTRIPAGLALMHGFSATNVGSGRLTVKPSLSVGVFNKGKASAKTSKKPGKEGRMNVGFREKDFLNKTCNEPRLNKLERKYVSSSSSSDSDTVATASEKRLDIRERTTARKGIPTMGKVRKLKDSHSDQDATSRVVARKGSEQVEESINRPDKAVPAETSAESIIWDIELDGASLPSGPEISESGKRSVLLNTRHIAWGASLRPPEIQTAVPQCQSPEQGHSSVKPHDATPAQRSSSSIGPSESASQYGRSIARCDLTIPGASSKYFNAPVIRDELPIGSPDMSAHSNDALQKTTPITNNKIPQSDTNLAIPTTISPLGPLSYPVPFVHDIETGNHEIIDSRTDSLEYLPEVNPEDYEYSDGDLQVWPLNDISWSEGLFQVVTDKHGNLYTDVELSCDTGSNNGDYLSFHQWHELEGASNRELYAEEIAYEMEYEDEREISAWAGDENHSLDCDNNVCDPRDCGEAYGFCVNESDGDEPPYFVQDYDSGVSDSGEDGHAYGSEDDLQEMSHNLSKELCSDEDGTVDISARFAQGRALLLGYSEQGAWLDIPPKPPRRPQVSPVEADVAKGLRNHWLPQKL